MLVSGGLEELRVFRRTRVHFQVPTCVRNLPNSVPTANDSVFRLQYSQCL